MANTNFTFLLIWFLLFVSVLLMGSWSLADRATKSMNYNNLTKEEVAKEIWGNIWAGDLNKIWSFGTSQHLLFLWNK